MLFSSEDEQTFFDKLKTHPVADFSFHLLIPEDMDRLCLTLHKYHEVIPGRFRDLFVKQIWFDGTSESLTVITRDFAYISARLSDAEIVQIAQDWSIPFNYNEPLYSTPAYQALIDLRKVSQDAVNEEKSLILHLLG